MDNLSKDNSCKGQFYSYKGQSFKGQFIQIIIHTKDNRTKNNLTKDNHTSEIGQSYRVELL